MAMKRHKPDEIGTKLRQVEVLQSQGMAITDAVHQIGVSELTIYYRWRKKPPPTASVEGAAEGERAAAQGGRRSHPRQADPVGGGQSQIHAFAGFRPSAPEAPPKPLQEVYGLDIQELNS